MGNLALVVSGVTISDPLNLIPPDANDGIVDNGTLVLIDTADPICNCAGGLASGATIPSLLIGGSAPAVTVTAALPANGTGGLSYAPGNGVTVLWPGTTASGPLIPNGCTSFGHCIWLKIKSPLPADAGQYEAVMGCQAGSSNQGVIDFVVSTGHLRCSAISPALVADMGAPAIGSLVQLGFSATLTNQALNTWSLQPYINGVPYGSPVTANIAGGVPFVTNYDTAIGAFPTYSLPHMTFDWYRAWVERFDQSSLTPAQFFAADYAQNSGRAVDPFS